MLIDVTELGWLKASGSPYEIGYALGHRGREAVHSHLVKCDLWKEVTSAKHSLAVTRMANKTNDLYPDIYEEIRGLAKGLDLPLDQVFAWNCRGDILSDTSDGCTTVQIPTAQIPGVLSPGVQKTDERMLIAHNEDGLPFFDGECFIAEISGEESAGAEDTGNYNFISFCYPGSIPGHTFALTGSGMVMTANNLRLKNIVPKIPRMVLGRAILNCVKIDEARDLLQNAPISGGFHYTIAQSGDSRLISLEFGGGAYSEKIVETPSLHANHAILGDNRHQQQLITQSSLDRQKQGNVLIANSVKSPLEILRDKAEHCLPIWRRDANDPDSENTIASAVFEITSSKISWTFHAGASIKLLYES
ncbi:MAG: C45 family peptidase [Halopseudomonas aestusnigri]